MIKSVQISTQTTISESNNVRRTVGTPRPASGTGRPSIVYIQSKMNFRTEMV